MALRDDSKRQTMAPTRRAARRGGRVRAQRVLGALALSSLAACGGGGGDASSSQDDSVFVAAWNPTPGVAGYRPGTKVLFFGTASGCTGQNDGPAAGGDDAVFAASLAQTGVAAASASQRWTPMSAASLCGGADGDRGGPSYVVSTGDPAASAIGLYTQAGVPGGFFAPYGAGGQDGSGANAFIEGTFVNFRQAWAAADAPTPFAATPAHAVLVDAPQSVSILDPGDAPADGTVVQVKRQFAVSFAALGCPRESVPARPCQLTFQFNVAIARAGVTDWSGQAWFVPTLVFDPEQGGIPVLDSPMPAAGTRAFDPASGLPLFTSSGAGTQHAPAALQDYAARINFAQLQNVVRLVVSRQLSKPVDQVVAADIAAYWGSRWDDPAAWVVVTTSVGQEVYDPLATHAASIGGSLQAITVSAVAGQ